MKTLLIAVLLLISQASYSQVWSITGQYNETSGKYDYMPGVFVVDENLVVLSLGDYKPFQFYIRSDEEIYLDETEEIGRYIIADEIENGTKTHIIITRRAVGLTIGEVQFIFRVD